MEFVCKELLLIWLLYEQGSALHIFYIDFKQAFDSTRREALSEDVKTMEIKRKLKRLVEMTVKRSKATILTEEGETVQFEFNAEVRQGDGLSTKFFNISLDAIIKSMNRAVQIVAHAKDLAVLKRDRNSFKETTLIEKRE